MSEQNEQCPECKGEGRTALLGKCWECNGTGKARQEKIDKPDMRKKIREACRCKNCQDGYIVFGDSKRRCFQCYKGYKLDIEKIIALFPDKEEIEKQERERILGMMNKRDVGGVNPEWALDDKRYQDLKRGTE